MATQLAKPPAPPPPILYREPTVQELREVMCRVHAKCSVLANFGNTTASRLCAEAVTEIERVMPWLGKGQG